jgi:hypothetical protein
MRYMRLIYWIYPRGSETVLKKSTENYHVLYRMIGNKNTVWKVLCEG